MENKSKEKELVLFKFNPSSLCFCGKNCATELSLSEEYFLYKVKNSDRMEYGIYLNCYAVAYLFVPHSIYEHGLAAPHNIFIHVHVDRGVTNGVITYQNKDEAIKSIVQQLENEHKIIMQDISNIKYNIDSYEYVREVRTHQPRLFVIERDLEIFRNYKGNDEQ